MQNKEDLPSVYYWDACVFLDYINATPNRIPVINAILDDCECGKVKICTSILSITEVAFAAIERNKKKLSKTTEAKIDMLWQPPSPILLMEVHHLIALDAKLLIRKALVKNWKLAPADAIHLASASRMNVDEFHTYDAGLLKFDKNSWI